MLIQGLKFFDFLIPLVLDDLALSYAKDFELIK